MKKKISKLALLLVMVATMFTYGCNGCTGDSGSDSSGKCLKKYNALVQTEFNSPQEALTEVNDFLSKYGNNSNCQSCCNNVEQMKKEFETMSDYFSDVDNSSNPKGRYCAFLSKANTTAFSNSSYETVKKTWKNYKQERKTHYLNERVDLIDGADFKPYLLKYAKDLAIEDLSGVVRVREIDEEHCDFLVDPVPVLSTIEIEGKTVREYTCGVRVGTQGIIGGKNKGHNDYKVTGTLEVSNSGCDLVFSKGNYILLEKK